MFQELILQIDEKFHLSLSLFNHIRNIKVFMFAAVAALLLAVVLVTPASAELPKGWNNLFQPPFQDTPTVMMAISCLSKDKCYISGGFDVFTFDGRQNGKFGFLNTPHMSMMMMAIGVGGTVEDPKGDSGGIGLGNGIQYFVNATTLMPSVVQPIFVITQDLRVSKDGTKVLIADAASLTVNQVLWSDDAGKTLRPINISTMVPAAGALPRYCSIANDTTWYVTLGQWPTGGSSSSTGGEGTTTVKEHHLSQRAKVVRGADGRWTRKTTFVATSDIPEPTGYSCIIAKTTDAGKTWHNVMCEASNYYPNGIDCVSATHCVAVGEGQNEKAGGHIWVTFDGLSFMTALHLKDNATGQWSLMTIAFVNEQEAWVGGSFTTPTSMVGVMFSTMDGGYTWTEHRNLDFLAEITAMSFTSDGYGFATALTQYETSTILRYDPAGPPRTPTPKWLGNFTQKQCADNACSVNCSTVSYPQNVCLGLDGGGSAIVKCATADLLDQIIFPFTANCTGTSELQPEPLNKCLATLGGGSVENYCGPSEFVRNAGTTLKMIRHGHQ